MNNINPDIKKLMLEKNNFTCQKCGFKDKSGKDLEIHSINPKIFYGKEGNLQGLTILCSICCRHAPDNEKKFRDYILDKIDSKVLDTFRKANYSLSRKTKEGMIQGFKKGRHLSKAPRGYNLVNKTLIVNEQEAKLVNEIFNTFLNEDISLTKLAKKYRFTTSGLKKLLQNTTYLGKVKFSNEEFKGEHTPIVSESLFLKVREKLSLP